MLTLLFTWDPSDVCADGVLHGGVEAPQCLLQSIRCLIGDSGGVA